MLWQVKGHDFWVECTVNNIEYLVNLLQISKIAEKPAKVAKGSPKRRRRRPKAISDEAAADPAEPCEVDAAQDAEEPQE